MLYTYKVDLSTIVNKYSKFHSELTFDAFPPRLPVVEDSPSFPPPETKAVLLTACGARHTLVVTEAGALWSCGKGRDGALGQDDNVAKLILTRVDAQHFGGAKIVTAAAGTSVSTAVTEDGALYTWGKAFAFGTPRASDTPACSVSSCPRASPPIICRALASDAATACPRSTPSPSQWAPTPG
jgi:alpha-tubulin suppressor-like RCC1 family protein